LCSAAAASGMNLAAGNAFHVSSDHPVGSTSPISPREFTGLRAIHTRYVVAVKPLRASCQLREDRSEYSARWRFTVSARSTPGAVYSPGWTTPRSCAGKY
jgi:hypothetical protein